MTNECGERSIRGKRQWLEFVAALLLGAGAAFGQLQTPNVQAPDRVDAVAITITPFGPYPSSLEHATGPFVLFILNRSGELEETFSLVRKPAHETTSDSAEGAPKILPSLLDLHSTHTKQRDHALIDPLPGDYELRFKSHPDWIVDITITAN